MLRQTISMGNRLGFRRIMAFWLRFAISPILTLRWLRFLQEFTRQHAFVPPHDDLVRKSFSAFLVHRMAFRSRFDILVQHFDVAGLLLYPRMLQTLWSGKKVEVGSISGRDQDYCLELCLADHCGSRHEGVFALRLIRVVDRAVLCTASFVFVRRPGDSYSIVIGGLQGSAQQDAKRTVIAATRDLGGLRPKDAVLLVLKGMMARGATPYLIAVSNSRHVINQRASARRRMRMRADLDAYWIERGGVHFPPFGFRLPVNPVINERCESRRDIAKIAFWQAGANLLTK
ncbi:virK protein [Mesorhizobium soli]|uniref:VirK protein n=1 Tax=Pseudaminobacter soli (ex Li et al. 2025) TaxID=1295366 RepID=A0A2P7RVN8_9HYPH|nr:virK protein [Mesorhizobium soli]